VAEPEGGTVSVRTVCDGCNEILDPDRFEVAITGERSNGMSGGRPLPDGEFHWCRGCAQVAFQAVKDQK
jgi:hypothetical protein